LTPICKGSGATHFGCAFAGLVRMSTWLKVWLSFVKKSSVTRVNQTSSHDR